MKICVTGGLLSNTPFTGVETFTYHLIRALSRIPGNEISVVANPGVDPNLFRENVNLIRHRPMQFPGRYSLSAFLFPPKCIDAFDVVHCPTVAAPFFFKPAAKVVMTVHDLIPILFPQWHILRRRLYFAHFLKYRFRYVDHFIAVSENTKADLTRCFGINREKISVIHNGIGVHFSPGGSRRDDYILAVGTIEPRKNLLRLMQAFVRLKDKYHINHQLVIAGTIGWKCKRELKLIESYPSSIKMLGYVSDQDLVNLYRNAVCMVYPSLYEGFGLPVIEAMACGCPVITSNLSSLPEVAGDAALSINPYNIDEISDAMHRLIADRNLQQRLSASGIQRAGTFSWDRCARETINVYQRMFKP